MNKWGKLYSTWSLSLQLTRIIGEYGLSLSQTSVKEKRIWHILISFLQQTKGELEAKALIQVPNVILHYTVIQIPILYILYKIVCWKNSLCSRGKRRWQAQDNVTCHNLTVSLALLNVHKEVILNLTCLLLLI